MSVVPVMILMIPVPFMHLPALAIVIIVRMVPIGPFIGRTIPAPCYPPIVMSMRGPVPFYPGVAWTRFWPTLLVPVGRWCASSVHANLSRSRDSESSCEQYAIYQLQFHFVSPIDYYLTLSSTSAKPLKFFPRILIFILSRPLLYLTCRNLSRDVLYLP